MQEINVKDLMTNQLEKIYYKVGLGCLKVVFQIRNN